MNLTELTTCTNGPRLSGGHSLGAILIDAGRLSADKAESILRLQQESGIRFGDAAIELGLVTKEDILFALARQFDYPYLPPEDNSLSHELLAAYQPHSPIVEQLRALRSHLMLRCFNDEGPRRALAIVSPGKSEGRSFIAANLAIVFSQLGQRTLLIDGDLRAPRQHELFKINNIGGLSGLLAGRSSDTELVIQVPSLLGLFVLPAGAVPPNPQELLGRPAFSETIQSMGKDFDVVIIDTPAASDYADARTIAVRASTALILARLNKSSSPAISELADSLRQSGATLVGSVLNDI